MRPPRLADEGTERWERLTELLEATSAHGLRDLSAAELDELARLYRRATADLARARARNHDPALVRYLNDLVGRAAGLVYGGRLKRRLTPGAFFLRTVPVTFRAQVRFVAIATLVFLAFGVLGAALATIDPAWADELVGPSMSEHVEEFLSGDNPSGQWFADPQAMMGADQLSGFILVNNVKVALTAFALGITFCLGTLWVLLQNGLMLGGFLGIGAHHGQVLDMLAVVAPHGVLELSAIFICAGAGLMMGWALVSPGDRLRVEALSEAARKAVVLVVGCIPIFLVAAGIEGILSPQTSGLLRANEPRLAFGAMTGLVLAAYLLFGDRLVGRGE